MRKAALALVLLTLPAGTGCKRGRPFARHETAPATATQTVAASDLDGGPDAGVLGSTLPNRLAPFASARLPPCGRPSGCGPWQVSWSKDDAEVALLGDDVVTVFDARGLGPKRRVRTSANALGERCFQAMVPSDGGIDFLDLRTGKVARHFKPDRPSPEDADSAKLALADDCQRWSTSLPVTNAVYDGDHRSAHRFAALQSDDTTSRIVPSGHFLQWNVLHDGKPMTAFEDARSAESEEPTMWFGGGSVISPDDALVVDTGGGTIATDEYGRRRPPEAARLARTADGMDVYALDDEFEHAAFCASSQLFAVTHGQHLELHWQEAAASLAVVNLPFQPSVVSFSNDGATLLVTGENAAMAFALQDCDYHDKCVPTAICAKK